MAHPVKVRGAGQIRKKDLIPFTRQMSGMLNAGSHGRCIGIFA